jgi:hypothetical protein
MGTLTLLEQMVIGELVALEDLRRAYQRMREAGRRLPWDDVEEQLARLARLS